MFPWNIAKSATEARFFGWALKHILKFFAKKRIGQFILGDIDLDQLDVQIRSGTFKLTDVALNVDYINQQLGPLPLILKEGSIGCLLVKFPSQIEVEELELVFAPCVRKEKSAKAETSSPSEGCKQHVTTGSNKLESETLNSSSSALPLDVNEGVKTIAKMVKWLLTSFHIKVKKLIVAYDPYSDKDKISGPHKALVLRIQELEYGTCVSEENNLRSISRVDSLLGLSRLTNFVKFQGAIIEFLKMDDVENQNNPTQPPGPQGTTFSESSIGSLPSEATTPILSGKGGGFSGNLKLSIPWRNGSLDIHKVDVDVSIDPIDLRLQPSTITWIFCLWQSLMNVDQDCQSHMHDNSTNSVYFTSTSQFHQSTMSSAMIATDRVLTSSGNFSAGYFSQTNHGTQRDALLRGSHVIPDWVALSTSLNQTDRAEAEPDLSASIDQFFECFDGLRSSHSALGNSGLLNWTCSVFNAITAASSLASGSLVIPSEPQPVETNFKASFSGISVELNLCDDDQDFALDLDKSVNTDPQTHYLGANCQGLILVLQICPHETKFEASVHHIELDDYFSNANEDVDSGVLGCKSAINHSLLVKKLQTDIHGALPPFPDLQDLNSTRRRSRSNYFPTKPDSMGNNRNNVSCGTNLKDDFVKMNLLKTSGVTSCQATMKTVQLDGAKTSSTSFSVKLPPFIFWVNFNLVKKLFDTFRKIEHSIEMENKNKAFGVVDVNDRSKSPCPGNMKRATTPCLTASSSKRSFRGSISLSTARIVLCFPLENQGDFKSYSLWRQFICLDITQTLNKENFAGACLRDANLPLAFSEKVSGSIYLNVEHLTVYLITGSDEYQNECAFKHTFFAEEVLSVTGGAKCFPCIGVLWQDSPVTGPWVAMRARGLVMSQDSTRSRTRVTGKGSEFAFVTTMGDQEDISSCTQEMIFSSFVLLHVRLPCVSVKLTSSQYKLLNRLLDQILGDLSHAALNGTTSSNSIQKEGPSVSQTSVLLECNSVESLISLDKLEDIKSSLQTELPGSWHKLKLQIQKLELLSVSNVGGICGSRFFWLGHGEGELRGSVDGFPAQELLLISCSDSTMRRGDGEGANALSSGSSGTTIVCLSDPQMAQSFTTVAIRGGTIVAPGGRLDWLNAISDFFSLSSEKDQACKNSDEKGYSEDSKGYGTSFVLSLVDVALCYEPWISSAVFSDKDFETEYNSYAHVSDGFGEHIACLLAASSLNLSNQTVISSTECDYKIRLQDVGLLICPLFGPQKGNIFDVEYIRKAGYVKVAGEALLEAVLRTNCRNGLLWELECCDSQINLDTCHDTTSGFLRLAAQLQQLFAPDLQESMVHMQSRWKAVQQVNCSNDFIERTDILYGGSTTSPDCVNPSGQDATCSSGVGVVGLMNDICEDAFQFNENGTILSVPSELQSTISLDKGHLRESYCSNVSNPEYFSHNVSFNEPMLRARSENVRKLSPQKECSPKLIEGYYISGLSSLPQVSPKNRSKNSRKCSSMNQGHPGERSGTSGWYKDNSPRIVENHIPKVITQPGRHETSNPRKREVPLHNCTSPDDICKARGRVLLKNIDVRWRMYAGFDWHGSTKNVCQKTGGARDTTTCLELTLSALALQYDMYPDGEVSVSKLSLSVQDFNLYDRSKDAPWKLILGYYHSKDHPRESSAKAFKLDLEAVRPDPSTPLEEYRLRLALLPMLLHLDQDQLDFLISFFGEKESAFDQSTRDVCNSSMSPTKSSELGGSSIAAEALLPFFQKFDIWPIVVRVDYSPRRVDLAALRGGNYVHLVNLVPWKGIELQLKHVHAVGIYGWSSVCETMVGEWLEDISRNQIHKFLRGLPPIRSLFTVGSGAAKLVSLPVRNYKKDHKVLKGIQRGAIAFLRSISLEAIGLGVHLAAGAHDILLQTEYIFTSIPPSVSSPTRSKTKMNVRSNQPKDAQQGIQQAYESLGDGLGKSASALVGNPLKTYQRGGGAGSALASAVCGAPSAAIAPASAAVHALHCALLGARNSLDPEHMKESMEKYLGPAQPQDHTYTFNGFIFAWKQRTEVMLVVFIIVNCVQLN
ncbi:Autophagy-related protein [Thalictrum thalictroides]|uniref:Autophagy-related protein 2 n=1 Tax=Thalictrum thalictroides TaxID=46969 RepID=A0A7J6V654_THATH|nr:Autophagy-related protein [Thalictrum thalictroides]